MEHRTIKGKIQNWEEKIAKNGKKYLLCKIDDEIHSFFAPSEQLSNVQDVAPIGTTVEFTEQQNDKGFWNIVKGSFNIAYEGSQHPADKVDHKPVDKETKIIRQAVIKATCDLFSNKDIEIEVLLETATKIEEWVNR